MIFYIIFIIIKVNMKDDKNKIKYEFLDYSNNFIYDARESGKTHTSFDYELLLFNAIKNGDVLGVKETLKIYKKTGLIIGHMSDDISREIHYWAVATIAVAIHYAILGGLDESEAYQLSDEFIQKIDNFETMEECIDYLSDKAIILANKVKENLIPKKYSKLINNCIHLIHINLHSRLRIEDIANKLNVSRDYLSSIFKKETGESIHSYILNKKLAESKKMLESNISISTISYTLCFSSESHFIQSFKNKYKITPAKYVGSLNNNIQEDN